MEYDILAYEAAKPLMEDIIAILPGAVIAGGFLRDTLMGVPTRDIDVLTETQPTFAQLEALGKLFDTRIYPLEFSKQGKKEDYVAEDHPQRDGILNVYKDKEENVLDIIVVKSTTAHIRDFPDNISKVFFGTGWGLVRLSDFVYGHANKVIKYRKTAGLKRLDKLKAKYPKYSVEMFV